MSDIGPGDLVVCVDSAPHKRGTTPAPRLVLRRCYRVDAIRTDTSNAQAWLSEHRGMIAGDGIQYSFRLNRFRKLNDEPDNAEIIARIKAPIREPANV